MITRLTPWRRTWSFQWPLPQSAGFWLRLGHSNGHFRTQKLARQLLDATSSFDILAAGSPTQCLSCPGDLSRELVIPMALFADKRLPANFEACLGTLDPCGFSAGPGDSTLPVPASWPPADFLRGPRSCPRLSRQTGPLRISRGALRLAVGARRIMPWAS